jgi:hypothetical protein
MKDGLAAVLPNIGNYSVSPLGDPLLTSHLGGGKHELSYELSVSFGRMSDADNRPFGDD